MSRFLTIWITGALPLLAADADLILMNGKVVTVDRTYSIQQAVAVKDGKIVSVGANTAVSSAQRGASTKVIDLQGKTVLPGLVDSHVHAFDAGLSEFRAPLPPLNSYAAIRSYIARQAANTPEGEWIVVPRTFPTRLKELRMPMREFLDFETKHPVCSTPAMSWS